MRSRKAFKNSIYALLLVGTTIIAGFIVPRLIIGAFGSAQYGLTVSITNFLGYLFVLRSGLGGVAKASWYKPLAEKDQEGIEHILHVTEDWFKKVIYISILYMVVLSLFMTILVKGNWGFEFVAGMVAVVGLGVLGRYFSAAPYQLLVAADQKEFLYSLVQILAILSSTILVVLLIQVGASLHFVMLGSGMVYLSAAYIFRSYVIRTYGIRKRSSEVAGEHLQERWAAIGHSVARFIKNKTDIFVITVFLNLTTVAIYSIYALVTSGLDMIITSIAAPVQAALGNIMAQGEEELLHANFIAYETMVHMISIILFSAAYVLILPFVKIYSLSFADTNYVQPLFAMILLTGELIYCLRLPYDNIIQVAGRFRDTKNAAFMEAGLNLALSIIMVQFFGIAGVVMGTLLSLLYRLIYFAVFLHQNILNLKYSEIIKRTTISAVNILLIVLITWKASEGLAINDFIQWSMVATVITVFAAAITLFIHLLFYREEVRYCASIFRRLAFRKTL